MNTITGFDSKETHRIINNEDRIFPLGASVEIYDYNSFKDHYNSAMNKVWEGLQDKKKRSICSFQYFAKSFGLETALKITTEFINEIQKHIILSNVYFTNIHEKKIPEIYMYNMDKTKSSQPISEFLTSLVQPYPYICAWKTYCQDNEDTSPNIILDNFQGKQTTAWNVVWGKKPLIYFKGDECNALISTADILAGVVDHSLANKPFSISSINKILKKELDMRGNAVLIGSPDLRWIVPTTRETINTIRFLKHPIYYLITKKPSQLEYKNSRDQILFSPMYDEITDIAYKNNGSIKFYDSTQDFMNIKNIDKIIYYEENGREIAESLKKQHYIDKAYFYGYDKIE